MWKCPNCETLNEGDICDVCGLDRASAEAMARAEAAREEAAKRAEAHKKALAEAEEQRRRDSVPTGPAMPTHRGPVPDTHGSAARRRAAVIVLVIAAAVASVFGVLQIIYSLAELDMENGEYDSAIDKFSNISIYRDAAEMVTECRYRRASDALENGDYDEAESEFSEIEPYRDSSDLILECRYRSVDELIEDGEYDNARDILSELEDNNKYASDAGSKLMECDYAEAVDYLENYYGDDASNAIAAYDLLSPLAEDYYKESYSWLNIAIDQLFYAGIELYREGDYSGAEECISRAGGYMNADSYAILINAHKGVAKADDLIGITGLEDSVSLITGNDGYMQSFMLGYWSSGTYYISYYSNDYDNGRIYSSNNFPLSGGQYYKLENGVHYKGSNEDGWLPQLRYTIESRSVVKAYCYNTGETYTLRRMIHS